jgi:hypothetical protein
MKKNQNTISSHGTNCSKIHTFLRMWNYMNPFDGKYCYDIFQYLKVENEKLQIVYANIRV